jgi:hypothetical protein
VQYLGSERTCPNLSCTAHVALMPVGPLEPKRPLRTVPSSDEMGRPSCPQDSQSELAQRQPFLESPLSSLGPCVFFQPFSRTACLQFRKLWTMTQELEYVAWKYTVGNFSFSSDNRLLFFQYWGLNSGPSP